MEKKSGEQKKKESNPRDLENNYDRGDVLKKEKKP